MSPLAARPAPVICTMDANEAVANLAYRASEVIVIYPITHASAMANKGARQNAPSFMSFEVTSEQQADIAPFLEAVKQLVHDAGLVLVSASPRG